MSEKRPFVNYDGESETLRSGDTLPGALGGTVTSVALSLPAIFSVSGSPVTGSGTLTAALATQPANQVFAGPASGAAAAPGFRALGATDIPSLDASKITSGLLAIARGGTNAANAADARTNLGLGTLATQNGTFSGTSSGTNTGDRLPTIGDAVSGGGVNRVLYENGSQVLSADANFTWASQLKAGVAGAGSVSPLFLNHLDNFSASAENRLDFGQVSTVLNRIASYYDGGSGWGFKFFTYNSGLNATAGLQIKPDNQSVFGGHVEIADAKNLIVNTTTGSKIGTATSQKIGLWNATPIVQPTTAGAAATFAANTSAIANDTATFDGYTLGQVVKALRNGGYLA